MTNEAKIKPVETGTQQTRELELSVASIELNFSLKQEHSKQESKTFQKKRSFYNLTGLKQITVNKRDLRNLWGEG